VADVRLLAAATALRPSDFLRLNDPKTGEEGFRLRPRGVAMELVLLKTGILGGCVFLLELSDKVARCGVYQHRPLVCATFPMTLRDGAVGIRTDDITCAANSWNLATMDLPNVRRDLVRTDAVWAEHWQLVRAWNAAVDASGRPRSADELFDYVLTGVIQG